MTEFRCVCDLREPLVLPASWRQFVCGRCSRFYVWIASVGWQRRER